MSSSRRGDNASLKVRRQRAADGRTVDDARRAALLRYVGSRVRSTQEVQTYLHRRGVASYAAAQLVADCQARGFLDDRVCARLTAEHWARRGYAWSAIRLKLAAKGLDQHAIHEAADRLGLASDDEARARRLIERQPRAASRSSQRLRIARRLASRGFDVELIERLLDDALGRDELLLEPLPQPRVACAGPRGEPRKERGGRRTNEKPYDNDE